MARRPSGGTGRAADRPINAGSRFRGPLLVARGPATDGPAVSLDQVYGRTKVLHNPCMRSMDAADSTALEALAVGLGAFATWERNPIGAGTNAGLLLDSPNSGAASPYFHIPGIAVATSTLINEGAQWVMGSSAATNPGLFSTNSSAGPARAWDPAVVVTFTTEIAFNANGVNSHAWAVGLLPPGTVAAIDSAGANVAAQPAVYFRIPQGSSGNTGALQCIYNGGIVGGAVNIFTITTTKTIAQTTPAQLGIRLVLRGISSGNPGNITNGFIEFWIGGAIAARMAITTATTPTPAVPCGILPGFAGVALGAGVGASGAARVAYMTQTIGPVRAGATNV